MKGLQSLEVSENGTVTFEAEVSHEDVEGVWQKDGVRLKPSPNISIGVLGKKHSLTLSSVTLEDAGLISFKADGIHSSGRLTVTGTQTPKVPSPGWGGTWLSSADPGNELLRGQQLFLVTAKAVKGWSIISNAS